METLSIRGAKTRLSSLVGRVAKGESFITAKRGKPIGRLVPIDEAPAPKRRRLGFMQGMINVPEDFDTMGQDEIEEMFYGNPDKFGD